MEILFILKAIIVAIIEGLTEFIPVSSTGHLILTSSIINFTEPKKFVDMYNVVIQLGAILAVVVLYWQKISTSVVEFFKYIFTKGEEGKTGFRFGINIIVGSIPAVVLGLLFDDYIESKLFAPWAVVVGFLVGGILLIVIENNFRKKKHAVRNIDKINPKQSLLIGFFQCLAMWPGMSRSASTIMGGWISGLATPVAAEYSFFLAIPAMVGSSTLKLIKFDYSLMTATNLIALIVGFIVAFIVALVVMKQFIAFLKKKPMRVFAVYRIGMAVVFAILIAFGAVSM